MFPSEGYKLSLKKIQSDENYCTGGNQALFLKKKNYLQIIAILLFYSFYTEMVFLFRKRDRKGVELMNLVFVDIEP